MQDMANPVSLWLDNPVLHGFSAFEEDVGISNPDGKRRPAIRRVHEVPPAARMEFR